MAAVDPEAGSLPQRRSWSRVPLRAKVRMEFAEQRYFLSEWAVNLSPGGMFVRSESAVAPGQRFTFEAALTPKGPRFGGTAEVLWVRREWDRAARPPGFAVHFLELEEPGRQAITRLAEVFLTDGVAAMQEDLLRLAAEWQTRRFDEESTDELSAADLEDEPLPDTAVIPPPFEMVPEDEDTAQLVPDQVGRATTQADVDAETPPGGLFGAPGGAAAAGAAATGDEAASAAVERGSEGPREDSETQPLHAAPAAVPVPPGPPARRRRSAGKLAAAGLVLLAGGGAVVAWRQGLLVPRGGRRAPAPAAAEASIGGLPAAAAATVAAGGPLAASPARAPAPSSFETLREVTWTEAEEGLWVTLVLDGPIAADAFLHDRLPVEAAQPAREMVKLLGARRGFAEKERVVGAAQLARIRFGFHPHAGGAEGDERDELRVVFDLTSAEYGVRRVERGDGELRLLVGPEPAGHTAPARPAVAGPAPATATAAAPAAAPSPPG